MCPLPPLKLALCVMPKLKTRYPKIAQSKFEVLTAKLYLVMLVFFNFGGRSVNCWSVFSSFIDWSYLWNKTFLRYNYIISDPPKKLFSEILKCFKFSEVEFLLIVRVLALAYGVHGSPQKCHL